MPFESRQVRLILAVLLGVTAILTLLYFSFLRSPMTAIYENIRERDASAIVAELDRAKIPYRLDNGGHDILVPESDAARARVLIAGSDLSIGGTVGFELFNDSDMGLTEFAQKINFQRAMQGELSRTIMSMDGVAFARVHLAIPERSIFRSEQGEATAAVTLQMAHGVPLTSQRIEGVRQLVASSVPNLLAGSVVVLDDKGGLVSESPAIDNGYGAPVTERGALELYYQSVGRNAIARILPESRFEISVNTRRSNAGPILENARTAPQRRDLELSVLVRTQSELSSQDREAVEAALVDSLQLDRAYGDSLVFSLGLVRPQAGRPVQPSLLSPSATRPAFEASKSADSPIDWSGALFSRWTWFAIVMLGLLALLLRPRRRLDDREADTFAEMLKNASSEQEFADAR